MNIRHASDDTSPNSATQAAAEWLTLLADDDSEEQRAAFLAWLRASTLHVEEFLRLSALERRLRRPEIWPADSLEELIAAAKTSGVTHLSVPKENPRSQARRGLIRGIAASIALSALAGGALFIFQHWDLGDSGATTYATEVGEQRSVTLSDGSVVDLNSRSRLRTRFTDKERRVQLLSGEAIFKVAKNPNRPFRVSVGATDIVAVGTAFNVDAHAAQTVVTVLEGRVRVTSATTINEGTNEGTTGAMRAELAAAALELERGEQVVIAGDRTAPKVAPVDPAKVIAWTQRRLIFENTPLEAVAAQFARYHTRTIRLNNDALKDRRITGVFDAHDPASLIEFLRTDHAISIEVDEDGWRLSSADLLIGTAAVDQP